MTTTDPYPKHICRTCLDELKIAVTFKKKCENSDYKFRQSSSNADSGKKTYSIRTHILYKNLLQNFIFLSIFIPGQVLQSNKVHDFQVILAQMQKRRELLETKIKFKTNETQPKSSPKFIGLSENNILHKCKQCDLQFDNKVNTIICILMSATHRKQRKIKLTAKNYDLHISLLLPKLSLYFSYTHADFGDSSFLPIFFFLSLNFYDKQHAHSTSYMLSRPQTKKNLIIPPSGIIILQYIISNR